MFILIFETNEEIDVIYQGPSCRPVMERCPHRLLQEKKKEKKSKNWKSLQHDICVSFYVSNTTEEINLTIYQEQSVSTALT